MDNFFTNWFRREAPEAAPVESKPQTVAKVRSNDVNIGAGNADTVAAFAHAMDLRRKTFARARFEYQACTAEDIWKKNTYGDKAHLNWLLHVKPNPYQNARQMWEMAGDIRDLSHNGLCCIYAPGMSRGRITALYPCTADWNNIDNTYNISNTNLNIQAQNVPASEVIVLRNGYGKSLVTVLKRTLEISATADNMNKDTLGKGGTFKAIVKQEVTSASLSGIDGFDDKEMEVNTDAISKQFEDGADFIYDPSAAAITQITQSFQDLQVLSTKDKMTEDVGRVTGTPLPLMFCSTNAVYKSADDALHTYVELTMRPFWDDVVLELNSKFLGVADYGERRFAVDVSHICIDSDKTKADTASVLVNAGIITQNEARHKLNLVARPEGDKLNTPKSNTNPQNKNANAQPDNA